LFSFVSTFLLSSTSFDATLNAWSWPSVVAVYATVGRFALAAAKTEYDSSRSSSAGGPTTAGVEW
jgi:hypothetical protein